MPVANEAEVRLEFVEAMDAVSKGDSISYYNFLIVAKRLNFKFIVTEHLMGLKNRFLEEGNQLSKQRLADILSVEETVFEDDSFKHYVKFRTDQLNAIKEVAEEEEDELEINQLKESTVALKLEDLERRLGPLQQALRILIQHKSLELMEVFDLDEDGRVSLSDFSKSLARLASYKHPISEQDSEFLFQALNLSKSGYLSNDQLNKLLALDSIRVHLAQFYSSSIDPQFLKRKRIIDFKKETTKVFLPIPKRDVKIEQSLSVDEPITEESDNRAKPLAFGIIRPKFGPLHRKNRANSEQHSHLESDKVSSNRSTFAETMHQKEKIERILRNGLKGGMREHTKDTLASKLRTIFVKRIILPREQLFEEVSARERARVGRVQRQPLQLPINVYKL